MTDQQLPITPPPELVEKWYEAIDNSSTSWKQELTTQAARWGADIELEACCELLDINGCPGRWIDMLRAARRPKPPSLKEQALKAMSGCGADDDDRLMLTAEAELIIRRAIESIPD